MLNNAAEPSSPPDDSFMIEDTTEGYGPAAPPRTRQRGQGVPVDSLMHDNAGWQQNPPRLVWDATSQGSVPGVVESLALGDLLRQLKGARDEPAARQEAGGDTRWGPMCAARLRFAAVVRDCVSRVRFATRFW